MHNRYDTIQRSRVMVQHNTTGPRPRIGISLRSGFIRQFCFIVSSVSRMWVDCAIIVVGCNEGLHAFASHRGVRGELNTWGRLETERFRTCHFGPKSNFKLHHPNVIPHSKLEMFKVEAWRFYLIFSVIEKGNDGVVSYYKSAKFITSVHFIVSSICVCDESLIMVNGGT